MGLAGARNSAVTGLQAQSSNISISADNIANAATPGYKSSTGMFSTLVTSGDATASYSSGGVSLTAKHFIDNQGLIEKTGRVTDLAISGDGFFAVQADEGKMFLTRSGAFDTNNVGELVTSSGHKLMGWPLDDNGLLPGAPGNTNTTAAETTESLAIIDTNKASGSATATSSVAMGANLNAGQEIYQGPTVKIDLQSASNSLIGQRDVIVPDAGLIPGDKLTLSSGDITSSYVYGGFSHSQDINAVDLFGATTETATFVEGVNGLADGDAFTVTSLTSGTNKFIYRKNSPDNTQGEFNSLTTLAEALDTTGGISARLTNGRIYLSSEDGNEALTFADVNGGGLVSQLGFFDVGEGLGNRFNTLYGLAAMVNDSTQLSAKVNSPAASSTLEIYAKDPLKELSLEKTAYTATVNLTSDENGNITENDLIVPINGATSMTPGTSTITVGNGTNSGTFTYGGLGSSDAISADNPMFGAETASETFTNGAGGLDDTDTITLTDGTNSVTVTYTTGALTNATDFNSLETLASAISSNSDFIARVVNGKLSVGTADADLGLTLSGTGISTAQINAALGGDFAATGTVTLAAGAPGTRFNTLAGLQTLVNGVTGITASISNTGADAAMTVSVDDLDADGLQTDEQLSFSTTGGEELMRVLGLSSGAVGDKFFTELGLDTNVIAANSSATLETTYDPTDESKNLAGGNISPHFSRNIPMYDALGTAHDFKVGFLKTGDNRWAVEVYALNSDEVEGASSGQVLNGSIEFNGDGSLKSLSSGLLSPVSVNWANGAKNSSIAFNWGTYGDPAGTEGSDQIGLIDGLRQFNSSYNVEFVNQNGVASGLFTGIAIDQEGVVSAKFTNGEVKPIYKIPLVTVANPNAMASATGNIYSPTQESGEINLKQAGQGNAGSMVSGSLEGSTADITEELTRTIGIQSNYNANATLISTIKSMEEELTRRL